MHLPHPPQSHPTSHLTLGTSESRLRTRLFTGLVAGVALMAAPAGLWANQVYKACGKKWVRQVSKLEAEKLDWLQQARNAELSGDLDGDGQLDKVVMTNAPSFRNCDVRHRWDKKETTVRIEYANGKKQLFFWISDQLVDKMTVFVSAGRILVVGMNARGEQDNRWVDYRTPPAQLAHQSLPPALQEAPREPDHETPRPPNTNPDVVDSAGLPSVAAR